MDTKNIKEIRENLSSVLFEEICHKNKCDECSLYMGKTDKYEYPCLMLCIDNCIAQLLDKKEEIKKPLTLLDVVNSTREGNPITHPSGCPFYYREAIKKAGYICPDENSLCPDIEYTGQGRCIDCWNRIAEKLPPVEPTIAEQFEASDQNPNPLIKEDGTASGAKHYNDMPIQPIELMQTLLTQDEFTGFLKGNIIKYAMRAGHKGDAEKDVAKMEQYTEWLNDWWNIGAVKVQ